MVLKNKLFILIVVASFGWSLGYSFYYRIAPVVDAQAYDRIAVNLVAGKGFKEDVTKNFEFDTAIVRAGPGYEFFLAGIYTIFGHHYEAVWIIQALLHAVSAALLYLICRRLFNERGETIGLIAAALFGLHPDLIEISAMLMTETVYLFFIILVVYLFVRAFEKPQSLSLALLLGLATGAATLTRPPVALFAPVILWFYLRGKWYRPAGVLCIALSLVLGPWIIRNYLIFHQFIPTTLIGVYNLWVGNTLIANGGQIAGGFNPLTTYTDAHGFMGLKARATQEFVSFIAAHPLVFIKLCFLRVIRYFSLIRPMGFWFYQAGLKQLMFVFTSAAAIIILFISGFSGMLAALRERRPVLYYLMIFAFISPLVLIPTVVESRYRFQIYPFLAIFGGYAAVALYRKMTSIKKNILIMGIFLFAVSLIDSVQSWPLILERLRQFVF